MSTDQIIDLPAPDAFVADGSRQRRDQQAAHSVTERLAAHAAAMSSLVDCEPAICEAAEILARTAAGGRRILTCGNGGSASEAQHFAAELVGRFRRERQALPAIALTTDSSILTAIANDYGYRDVFARQVEALGHPGDTLVGFTTSGESANVLRAAERAREMGISVIGVTGEGQCSLCAVSDVVVHVPSADTPTIQELHMVITHILCDVIETRCCEGGWA